MSRYVAVTSIVKGDEILVFSRRRVNPSVKKVRAIFAIGGEVHLDTPGGRVTVPRDAEVQVPDSGKV